MAFVNLSIPLRTTSQNGFFIHGDSSPRYLLGHAVRMRLQEPYVYLELQNIPSEVAPDLLDKIRLIVPWAALRLNFGILSAPGDLRDLHKADFDGQKADFDGQFATAYPAHLTPQPARIEANHRREEADTLLFSALIEGAELQRLIGSDARPELKLSCEMFASVDFEASDTAQFLALISILEIMAKPAPRPARCLEIIDSAMAQMKSEAEAATDPELRQDLLDMHKGAVHWKAESIRSSVRRLAVDTSRTLGDAAPESAGKSAVKLYDKRSRIVHGGETATADEAREARRIVREVLAVAADSYHRIRERFLTS